MAPDRTSMYAKLLQAEDDAEAANEEAAANPTGRTTALAAKRAARQQSAEAIRTIAKAKEAKLKADAAEAAAAAEAVRKKVFAAKMKSEKAKQEADEFAIAEMDRKTKRFTLKDGRGRVKETGALYFGDYEDLQAGAWQPHGFGEFRVNGETIYEGNFFKGRVCGNGYIKFLNDDDWRGSFRNDEPHGLGIYKYSSGQPPRAALYFRSRRACFLDELIPGTRIRMVGRKWKLGGLTTGTVLSSDNVADVALRGTMREMLARLVGTAKIRVKFDLGPVQMVNLAEEEFEIVHGQPSCHMHDHFIEDAGTLRPRYHRPRAEKRVELWHTAPPKRWHTDTELRYDYAGDVAKPKESEYTENFYNVEEMSLKQKQAIERAAKEAAQWEKQRQDEVAAKAAKEALAARKKEVEAGRVEKKRRDDAAAAEKASEDAELQKAREALAERHAADHAEAAAANVVRAESR